MFSLVLPAPVFTNFTPPSQYINKTFTEDKVSALGEITMDEDVAAQVYKAAQSSMGMDCSAIDMTNIMAFTQRMVKLAEYRRQVYIYTRGRGLSRGPSASFRRSRWASVLTSDFEGRLSVTFYV